MKKLLVIVANIIAVLQLITPAYCLPTKHHLSNDLAPSPLTTEQITAKTLPSVVSITVKDANSSIVKTGSGVVIGTNIVATCYHVIAGASTITVNYNDGRSVTAYGITAANKDVDVAILGADTHGMTGPDFALKTPNLGTSVVAIGNPEGLNGSVSTGIVSGVRDDNNRTLLQTTAPISAGSSGGALVDGQGHLLGITSETIPDGENLNFAISILDVASVAIGTTASFADLKAALSSASSGAIPASSTTTLPYTTKPLTGVIGLSIVVEDIDQDAISDGLAADTINTDAQLELHKDEVPFDATNMDKTTGHGYLYIQPILLKLSNGDYSYSINLEFNEIVTLTRDTPIQSYGATWTHADIGYVTSDNMVKTIRQEISDMIDNFATDYVAQNPKQ